MSELFFVVLVRSLGMSLVVLLLWLISPLLSRWCQARGRYFLWTIVTLLFLIPPLPSGGLIHLPLEHSSLQTSNALSTESEGQGISPLPFVHNTAILSPASVPVTINKSNEKSSDSETINVVHTSFVSSCFSFMVDHIPQFFKWGGMLWLAGFLFYIAKQIIDYRRFCQTVKRWSRPVTDEKTLHLFETLKTEMKVSTAIGLRTMSDFESPLMYGFLAPTILLPDDLSNGNISESDVPSKRTDSTFDDEELAFILKHELIHYQHRDLWIRLSVVVATAVHWFNPLIRLSARRVETECEISCDERIVSGQNELARCAYAETILGVVRVHSRMVSLLTTRFYWSQTEMKQRINAIFNSKTKRYGKGIIAMLIMPVLLAILLFDVRAEEPMVNQSATSSIKSDSAGSLKLPTPEEREEALEELPVNEQEYRLAKAQYDVGHPNGTLKRLAESEIKWRETLLLGEYELLSDVEKSRHMKRLFRAGDLLVRAAQNAVDSGKASSVIITAAKKEKNQIEKRWHPIFESLSISNNSNDNKNDRYDIMIKRFIKK